MKSYSISRAPIDVNELKELRDAYFKLIHLAAVVTDIAQRRVDQFNLVLNSSNRLEPETAPFSLQCTPNDNREELKEARRKYLELICLSASVLEVAQRRVIEIDFVSEDNDRLGPEADRLSN